MRLNMIVEGRSEETFVRDVLTGHLSSMGVYPVARCVTTSRRRGRPFRGGLDDYAKARRDIVRWLSEDQNVDVRFTTMFDLYRLPGEFPGHRDARKESDPYKRVAVLERSLGEDVGDRRFIPYIQLHEFEALLFADIEKMARYYSGSEYANAIAGLKDLAAQFKGPEWIDDGETTAPSKRIGHAIPEYLSAKRTAGPLVAGNIGLDTLKNRCPHFKEWLGRLEALA